MRQPTNDLRTRMRTADEVVDEGVVDDLPTKATDVPDPVVEAAPVARPFMGMDSAPHDGSLIEVRAHPDGIATYTVYWRITRRRSAEERAWKVIGFWADPARPTEQLPFEPVEWRHHDFRVV